ncbi:hypothetical protein KUTeg_010320 [Tegillarca granosa]|uniref:SRCR domain-containing protein n=1 Tax=Tegillarca granosa TaxID=220873 RepID=A0ABQ9F9B3_TEGGR|nr:hypothetical protein KUTeg_010320 [Tegillarca granosa]
MNMRLVGGEEANRGRLEVLFMDTWGTVCGNNFTDELAGKMCEMFGYGFNGYAVKGSLFGNGIGPIWLDNISCSENDTSLMYCNHTGWGNVNCVHNEDIGIWCSDNNTDVQVRLNGSLHNDRGRVEVHFMDIWGTICNNGWNDNDASLVCRKLGFINGGIAVSGASYGPGSGIIWLENVDCSSEDTNITDCQHAGWGNTDCDHSQDAGVICLTEGGIACSPWGTWASCSVTCANGTTTRSRKCRRPDAKENVELFGQDVIDVQNCSTQIPCPIDGEWNDWSDWSTCSASCGRGLQTKRRFCNNPPAENGGQGCVGNEYEAKECLSGIRCPVDGNWSQWSAWSKCSVTCENGTRTRSRDCSDPPPMYGGNFCNGQKHEEINCSTFVSCPVNGEWGNWTSWSDCSVSCERGYRTRTRQCNEPSPNFGGMPCVGNSYDAEECVTGLKCPVDGHWSVWEEWSECTVTCGNGTSLRTRICNNPAPYFGGRNCMGHDNESVVCNTDLNCPVDGQWNTWNQWSDCSVTCECGYIHRERNCSNPFPNHGGKNCSGDPTQIITCFVNKTCPVHCDEGYFLCQDNITCIGNQMACDSIKQCPDGEDEINCLFLFSVTADSLVADLVVTSSSTQRKQLSLITITAYILILKEMFKFYH